MGKKDVVLNRQYTDEFKVEAVRLSESIGGALSATFSAITGSPAPEREDASGSTASASANSSVSSASAVAVAPRPCH